MNIERHWYRDKNTWVAISLLPLSYLFRLIVSLRYFLYRCKIKKSVRFPVPVIVVGNITVGGTGKTPMVIWLVNFLRQQGFKPGVVSRGVGGKMSDQIIEVKVSSDASQVGDEALLIVQRAQCPMVVGKNRVAAVQALLTKHQCDVVISDDGLQHYRLRRDVEIVMMDGDRKWGNGQLLPAGPLREPYSRLLRAQCVVVQGETLLGIQHPFVVKMQLQGDVLHSLQNSTATKNLVSAERVHAIAGIGHPERFFAMLRAKGLNVIPHPFPDHYTFQPKDIEFGDELPVIMTEKDAVKCVKFAGAQHWYLPVETQLDADLGQKILTLLKEKRV